MVEPNKPPGQNDDQEEVKVVSKVQIPGTNSVAADNDAEESKLVVENDDAASGESDEDGKEDYEESKVSMKKVEKVVD